MTTTSFPVIQIEKTGKRLRNMRKENGIRVAAVCEYMGGISEQAVYKWNAVFPKQKDIKKQPMFTCLQTKEYCY